jgi:hypothetical protein
MFAYKKPIKKANHSSQCRSNSEVVLSRTRHEIIPDKALACVFPSIGDELMIAFPAMISINVSQKSAKTSFRVKVKTAETYSIERMRYWHDVLHSPAHL